MVVLLLLGYAAICVVIFKLLHVPVNKWSLTTAVLGAVAVVGGLLAGLNYNHPFTTDGRIYFYTTAITPTVKGTVVEVDARPNVKLKQGDALVQRNTIHNWINRGTQACVIAFVLVPAKEARDAVG